MDAAGELSGDAVRTALDAAQRTGSAGKAAEARGGERGLIGLQALGRRTCGADKIDGTVEAEASVDVPMPVPGSMRSARAATRPIAAAAK